MTTIILTLIGVLLAATATLMIMFYGGDVFGAGRVAADASTLANAGTNLLMASQLHEIDRPGGLTGTTHAAVRAELIGEYLSEDPSLPAGMTIAYSKDDFRVTGVSEEVCDRVSLDAGITPTAIGQGKMNCFEGTFYANF